MSNKAVIGLGFGDEGKGVTTEYLTSLDPENTIVIRFSGGQQAGHKVLKGDVEHIFSNFGSGTLSGCPTYWSKHCTFDPKGFLTEHEILKSKGISPKVYIHPDCAVTTPYDILANQQGQEMKHGTTGVGFFQTKNRHFNHRLTFTVSELLCKTADEITCKLEQIADYYNMMKEGFGGSLFRRIGAIRNLMDTGVLVITRQIPIYKHKVFEGSQGLMLDERIGTMPHCTPSDIRPTEILKYGLDEVFLVTRCYQTRHGNGPMTNEKYPVELVNTEHETNVYQEYQGGFRTSILDLDQLIHAKEQGIDGIIGGTTKVNLVITCMDQMSEYWVSHGDQVHIIKDVEKFAAFIANSLGVYGGLYVNNSPYSSSITLLSG